MTSRHAELTAFLDRVRRRWRALVGMRAWTRSATAAATVLALGLAVQFSLRPAGAVLIALWSAATILALVCLALAALSLRRSYSDRQIARFVEESCPELDDALVTAVEKGSAEDDPVVSAVVADALRRIQRIDPGRAVAPGTWHRAARSAAAASAVLLMAAGFSAGPITRACRVLVAYAFPQRVTIAVSPGNVKVKAGTTVRIIARLPGSPDVVPALVLRDRGIRKQLQMARGTDGYVATLTKVDRAFAYAVAAAGVQSPEYAVTVTRAPRIRRIDLRYEFPPAFRMQPRTEDDGGDIYGPAGTRVHLTIHADKPVTNASLNVAGRPIAPLRVTRDTAEGDITISDDGSYRIALADADGLKNPGETEYFIRTIADRPPDVRIVRPASDRQVSPLEEVTVEAKADDDYGVAAFELVYAIRGRGEKVVPFKRDGSATSVTGVRTIYLEDLGVQPGDFVSYYARARDVGRATRGSEARSDMFFLEVKPFDTEFAASQSQGSGGGSGNMQSLEELIQGEKDVITATWRLDRRAHDAGSRSADDIKAVARAQDEVRQHAAAVVAQMQRSADLRRRRRGGARQAGRGSESNEGADDPVFRAMSAMEDAQKQLEGLKTADALPLEMTALNELLRAQAEVRRREVQRQEASNGGSGSFSNRQEQDLSALFDRELTRQQQTNYEAPRSAEKKDQNANDALDRIRDLARRQEALNRDQARLDKDHGQLSAEEVRRQLDRLTREESELRQQVEELARKLGQKGTTGTTGAKGSNGASGAEGALQEASKEMQNATSDLRRQDPGKASASGERALQQLHDVEQRLGSGGEARPDERRRHLGDMQLEARQLADAQRRLGASGRSGAAGAKEGDAADNARAQAGEQERLAERTKRLEDGVKRLAGVPGGTRADRDALKQAASDVDRLKLSERMRKSADAARHGAGAAADAQQVAKALDGIADRLGSARGESDEAKRLGEQLARVRDLRERLAAVDRQLAEAGRNGGPGRAGSEQGRGESTGGGSTSGAGAGSSTDWQQAEQLLQELRHQQIAVDTHDIEGFHPGKSAPGTEPWKQDYSRWDELKRHAAVVLEKLEEGTAERLRAQQSKDRLNAGAADDIPEQYRDLVDRYYRALASERK